MTFQTIFSFRKTYKLDIETQLDTQKLGNMSLQILRKGENEMAKKEVKTDLWVARQLDDSKIKYDAQGSDVKEINDALQSASKRGTGNAGYPEYVAVVKDFVIVIEDKADLTKHQKLSNTGILSIDQKDIADYAVNGAYFYAKHIAQNSSFHKIFAIGVSGDEKHHKITPLYVDDRDGYKQLPDIESFTSFTAVNIDEYYTRYVLAEKTDVEKTTEEILKDAAELHEYLRTYGSLKDQDKPLVVSGILLALDDKFFKPDDLLGDETTTDGQLIYDAIQRRLKASNVGPDAKRDKLMSEFSIIRTSARLNEVDAKLGKTPLKFYTEFLKKNVFPDKLLGSLVGTPPTSNESGNARIQLHPKLGENFVPTWHKVKNVGNRKKKITLT